MNKSKFKKGDNVIVIAGDSKGIIGSVLAVSIKKEQVKVQGVNMRKPKTRQSSDHTKIEAFIHRSNIMHFDSEVNVATKIGIKISEDGTRLRFSRKTDSII